MDSSSTCSTTTATTATTMSSSSSEEVEPPHLPPLFIFDFDCTITSRHFWGLMNGDLNRGPRSSKVRAADVEEVTFLRQKALKGFGSNGGDAFIRDDISGDVKDRLIKYVFGSEARLSWLRAFLMDLKTNLGNNSYNNNNNSKIKKKNVQIELWTRSYGKQVRALISKDYVDLLSCFDKIVDRESFFATKSDYLDEKMKASFSSIFIFEDSVEEFPYDFDQTGEREEVGGGGEGLFDSCENIYSYYQLEKDGRGILEDPRILQEIGGILLKVKEASATCSKSVCIDSQEKMGNMYSIIGHMKYEFAAFFISNSFIAMYFSQTVESFIYQNTSFACSNSNAGYVKGDRGGGGESVLFFKSFCCFFLSKIVPLALPLLNVVVILSQIVGLVKCLTLIVVLELYFQIIFLWAHPFLGRYSILLIYITLLFAMIKKPSMSLPRYLYSFQYILWDLPLLLWMELTSLIGQRALDPFISDIDEFISVGSLPLRGDGLTLSKHGVGFVVNMCYETEGIVDEYKKYGIKQIRAPTLDIAEASLRDIIRCVRDMKAFYEDRVCSNDNSENSSNSSGNSNNSNNDSGDSKNDSGNGNNDSGSNSCNNSSYDGRNSSKSNRKATPNDQNLGSLYEAASSTAYDTSTKRPLGRLFIHCKGGRGRAISMAICFYLTLGTMNMDEICSLIKRKRPIAETNGVKNYKVVKRFEAELMRHDRDINKLFEVYCKSTVTSCK